MPRGTAQEVDSGGLRPDTPHLDGAPVDHSEACALHLLDLYRAHRVPRHLEPAERRAVLVAVAQAADRCGVLRKGTTP